MPESRKNQPSHYGSSPFAQVEATLRAQYPDLDAFELGFALRQGAPLQDLPAGFGINTADRVGALREVERRTGLPRPALQEVVATVLPRLLAVHLNDPDAIEAAVRAHQDASLQLVEPALAARRRKQTSKAREIVQARKNRWKARAIELRAEGMTIAQVAVRLSGERHTPTSVRTVSRWLETEKD